MYYVDGGQGDTNAHQAGHQTTTCFNQSIDQLTMRTVNKIELNPNNSVVIPESITA